MAPVAALVLVASGCGSAPDAAPGGPGAASAPGGPSRVEALELRAGWTRLAGPPAEPLADAMLVVAGGRLVMLAHASTSPSRELLTKLAAYEFAPETRSWRALGDPPLSARGGEGVAATGDALLVWGGFADVLVDVDGPGSRLLGLRGDGAVLRIGERRWRKLPNAPISARAPAITAAIGTEILVWGSADRSGPGVRDGAAYDPASHTWRRTAPSPDLSAQASTVAWNGREAIAWDYLLAASAYDPSTGHWREAARLPLRMAECYPESAALGETIVGWYCGRGAFLAPGRARWTRLPAPPRPCCLGRPVGAGAAVAFLRAESTERTGELWAYRPAP